MVRLSAWTSRFLIVLSLLGLISSCEKAQPSTHRISFESGGLTVQGHFFQAGEEGAYPTAVMVPGWPGNPDDVLGLGAALSRQGINVLIFNPRGMHESEGIASFPNTLQDIGAALRWLRQPDVQQRFGVDTTRLTLGGHSYGGGTSMAYAAGDPRVQRVIHIAGADHGEMIREWQQNADFAEAMRRAILRSQAPEGPIRFDMDADLKELAENKHVYGLRENAANLADRSILLIGGWDDVFGAPIEIYLLPLYRALKRAGAEDVTIQMYHDGHNFSQVRDRLASDVLDWIKR